MRMHVGIAVAILAVVACMHIAYAQDTLVVSERVGKVIDKYERWYYQLFPKVNLFESAVIILKVEGATAQIRGEYYQEIPISEGYLRLLTEYLSSYDSLFFALHSGEVPLLYHNRYKSARKKYYWLNQKGLIAEPIEFSTEDVTLSMKTDHEKTVQTLTGKVLWADEKGVVFLPGEDNRHDTLFIPSQSLSSVKTYGRGGAAPIVAGGLIGAIAGGIIGYNAVPDYYVCSNTGCERTPSGVVVFVTVALAASFAGLGILIGAIFPTSGFKEIASHEEYLAFLPFLQSRMYYRYGLPPESPWR